MLTQSEVQAFIDGLAYAEDDRAPPDVFRKRQFTAGWNDAAVRAREYTDDVLNKLTLRNLGYRFGQRWGPQATEDIQHVYELAATLFGGGSVA